MALDIPNIMQKYGIQNDIVQFWYYLVLALKTTNPKLLAYLVYMTIRLIEMHLKNCICASFRHETKREQMQGSVHKVTDFVDRH
jgi:hypothetical protein